MNKISVILETHWAKYCCLFFALLYSLSFNFWGWGFTDHVFWLNMTWFIDSNLMNAGSLWLMNVWMNLLGRTLISSRILAWFLNTMALLLPYCIFFDKKERFRYMYYLCGAFVILGSAFFKISSADNFTSLVFVLIIISFVKWIKSDCNIGWLIMLTILSGIAPFFRFPNVVIIPFFAIVLLCCDTLGKKITHTIVFLSLSITIYYVCISLLLHSYDFIHFLQIDLAKYSGTKHTAIGLLLRYAKGLFIGTAYLTIILVIWKCTALLKIRNIAVEAIVMTIVPVMLLCLFLKLTFGSLVWPGGIPIIIGAVILLRAYKKWKSNNKQAAIYLLVIMMISMIPSAGSDCGFFKSFIVACALIPFAMKWLEQEGYKRKATILCCIISIVSIIQFNEAITWMDAVSSNQKYKYILENQYRIKELERLENEIQPYFIKDKTIFYGTATAHTMYFATGTKPIYEFYYRLDKDDERRINEAITGLNNDKSNVLIDFSKSDEAFFLRRGLHVVAKKERFNVYSF